MSKKLSRKTREKRKWGQGHGKDYHPYITANEFARGRGTRAMEKDWKTGRTVHLMSMGERKVWLILNFMDNVKEIREQFPLDFDEVNKVRKELGYCPITNKEMVKTTDFLVTRTDGTEVAISVKNSKSDLNYENVLRSLKVEKEYWIRHGVKYYIIFSSEINSMLAENIYRVTRYFDVNDVFDATSAMKHLIATKKSPMTKEELSLKLDFSAMAEANLTSVTIKKMIVDHSDDF